MILESVLKADIITDLQDIWVPARGRTALSCDPTILPQSSSLIDSTASHVNWKFTTSFEPKEFEVAKHNVPQLIDEDEQLRVIEMSVVVRPFVLDFAGAKRPEEVPDFEQHVLDEHMERLAEMFEERLGDALHVAEMFRRATGFVLLDIHPGNIAFAD